MTTEEPAPLTPAEAMYLLAKSAGAGVDDIGNLEVLAVRRCSKEKRNGRCQRPLAYLYATRLGPLLVAVVPNEEHELTGIPTHRARRGFADSRDETLGARSEWDLVDAVLTDFEGWHPEIHTVICPEHGRRPFSRDTFVADGRRRRGRTVDVDR